MGFFVDEQGRPRKEFQEFHDAWYDFWHTAIRACGIERLVDWLSRRLT